MNGVSLSFRAIRSVVAIAHIFAIVDTKKYDHKHKNKILSSEKTNLSKIKKETAIIEHTKLRKLQVPLLNYRD